ncbi:MAG: AbrB/MazE/SpoVT family DNA-binding domain-containing protein [SAR202 cluster bacterium]|nr:AbrB/MazE/SpoVT family DNA-binding domain-containing protein [SAR202 cluster bacterium]
MTTVSDGGRIVIPSDIRKAMGIVPGTEVILLLQEDGELRVMARERAIRWTQDMVKKYDRGAGSPVDELIKEREAESARE